MGRGAIWPRLDADIVRGCDRGRGGHGATLDTVAAAGMAVHGIASIFTILGGAAFVIFAIRALRRASPGQAAG
jgi:hypothetical protein